MVNATVAEARYKQPGFFLSLALFHTFTNFLPATLHPGAYSKLKQHSYSSRSPSMLVGIFDPIRAKI